jgi:hypothetical protein
MTSLRLRVQNSADRDPMGPQLFTMIFACKSTVVPSRGLSQQVYINEHMNRDRLLLIILLLDSQKGFIGLGEGEETQHQAIETTVHGIAYTTVEGPDGHSTSSI